AFSWAGEPGDKEELLRAVRTPSEDRQRQVQQALRAGATVDELYEATRIDRWFLDQLLLLEEKARELSAAPRLDAELLRSAKRLGISDVQIGGITGRSEKLGRGLPDALDVHPVYLTVDTCAAEFTAKTPYLYSSYDEETEVPPRSRPKVIILGSGPNRIGQ